MIKKDPPLVYANEEAKEKLAQFSKVFEQFVLQETQKIKSDIQRIVDVIIQAR